ncbi:MAG: iron-sulfur cluster loop [Betaproteobacteria bacterium]|nr:iron-sulfur cluster loop [Betaproteobacteria bacterium]
MSNLLVQIGKDRFADRKAPQPIAFTRNAEYDAILNDLTNVPHAFVLACMMDRQMQAERAWSIPGIIMKQWGTSVDALDSRSEDEYIALFNEKRLHRFNNNMAKVFKGGVRRIKKVYAGDASMLWKNKPSSAKVVYDFLQFKGVGIKIATMAANILARQFQIAFSDYYSIDVSPDVHVRRVMWRMGLIEDQDDIASVIDCARELNPEFPGIIDFSAWEIGREYCRPTNPRCNECSVSAECQKRLA